MRNTWPLDELGGVNLEGENLKEGINLKGTKLVRAKLNGAILKKAELNEAILKRAELEYSDMEDAKLIGADLEEARLRGGILKKAELNNANLFRIQLHSANLTGADFREVKNLREADLRHAIFDKNTDFRGADIDSITIDNLDGSNWWDAKWDPSVREEIEKKYGKK